MAGSNRAPGRFRSNRGAVRLTALASWLGLGILLLGVVLLLSGGGDTRPAWGFAITIGALVFLFLLGSAVAFRSVYRPKDERVDPRNTQSND